MEYADAETIEAQIADLLNAATGGFGTTVTKGIRKADPDDAENNPIRKARIASGFEVLRALAANSRGGLFGEYVELVTVEHNEFLPAHEGEPGIPLIVPFEGASARAGYPADPDKIDSYREESDGVAIYTGALGSRTAHDQSDANGMPSPVSCRYFIFNSLLKFTGHSCRIPLFPEITEEMADTKIPASLAPTVVKLSIPRLVKEGDNLYVISERYRAWGQEDLIEIRGGAERVRPVPVPEAVTAQKQLI
ncbi:MAG TPA: hypothetical protein VJS44_08405 [Pyrinomonadaceae bacterium]|nr:hypothetical protein [Pyrinomonadaceae bacterium]